MANALLDRYTKAYRSASTTIQLGNGVRAGGLLFGLVLVVVGMIASSSSTGSPAWDKETVKWIVISGLAIALVGALIGVLLSTVGHILRATLDAAVICSPTLSPHEQQQAMNIE